VSAPRRHRGARACAWLGGLAVAALLAAGCDYFKPVTPEPPTNTDVVAIDLSSPDLTLETLRLAVEAKGLRNGDVAYRACFAESTAVNTPAFHAFFWPEDANAWTSQGKVLPSDWTYRDEAPFYNVGPRSIASLRDEPYQMSWEVEKPDEFGTGSAVLHRHYLVIAEGTSGVAEIIAKGYADLVLVQQSTTGNWVITQWQDRSDPDVDPLLPQKTWGLRRLESR
jgi:hypothetical protein